MARSDSAQKSAGFVGGGRVDFGTYAFSGSAVTVELPTTLTTILAGLFVIEDDNLTAKCDRALTAGKVTVTRATGGTSGATLSYIMAGY